MEFPKEVREKIKRYRWAFPENSEEHPNDVDLLETYKIISQSKINKLKEMIKEGGES